jgi:hypothetical protein
MHRPYANELAELELVLRVGVPEAHSDNSCVICEHNLDASLGCLVGLARFGLVMKVHNAAHESEVPRPRFKTAEISFFVVEHGLHMISIAAGLER